MKYLGLPPDVATAGLVLFIAIGPLPSRPWQDEGHVLINRVAAEHIPADMPAFFRDAVARLAYLGPEPDRWREEAEYTLKASQEPDHFIKLEALGGGFEFDRSRYVFYRQLYDLRTQRLSESGEAPDELLPENVGLLPYITIEIFDRLKAGFRQYRELQRQGAPTELVEGNIILYAGWLGHYVADAAEPHHTSIQYDGWSGPNPKGYAGPGIHGRFEGDYVRAILERGDLTLSLRPPEHLESPFDDVLDFLLRTHELVERVYELDRSGGFEGAGSDQALEFTHARLAAASQMLLNLWYTAWLDSRF